MNAAAPPTHTAGPAAHHGHEAEIVTDPRRQRNILIAMCTALVAVVASVSGLNVAQQDLAIDLAMPERLAAVTRKDLLRVAQAWLAGDPMTVLAKPKPPVAPVPAPVPAAPVQPGPKAPPPGAATPATPVPVAPMPVAVPAP